MAPPDSGWTTKPSTAPARNRFVWPGCSVVSVWPVSIHCPRLLFILRSVVLPPIVGDLRAAARAHREPRHRGGRPPQYPSSGYGGRRCPRRLGGNIPLRQASLKLVEELGARNQGVGAARLQEGGRTGKVRLIRGEIGP